MIMDKFPFAVRLAGFPPEAEQALKAALLAAPAHGPAYFCLSDHSLQDPDLVLAHGPDLKAMALLSSMAAPGQRDTRPALVLGAPAVPLPYPVLPLPFDPGRLHVELAQLVRRRADALARLAGAGLPPAPERRRSPRLDFDLTDPAEYEAMRSPSRRGAVLVVDGGGALSRQTVAVMRPCQVAVLTAAGDLSALAACNDGRVAVVLVDTALAGIDVYALGGALRVQGGNTPPAVVAQVAPPFAYDPVRAGAAGLAGLLDAPLADGTLKAVLKRLMNIP